jgi:hypothetical protein
MDTTHQWQLVQHTTARTWSKAKLSRETSNPPAVVKLNPHPHPSTHSDTASLAQMVQATLEDRRMWETEIAEEHRSMREQISMLQRLVMEKSSSQSQQNFNRESLGLTKLTEQDNMEASCSPSNT